MSSKSNLAKIAAVIIIAVVAIAGFGLGYYLTIRPHNTVSSPTPSPSPPITSSTSTSPTPTPSPTPTFSPAYSTKTIVRSANTEEEKTALQSAEDFDYANASNAALYRGQYANFIDTSVINYYSGLADSSRQGITMNYQASSSAWSQAKVTITSNSIQVTSPTKGTVSVTKNGYGTATFAYLNGAQYQVVKEGAVNLDLPNCYVVRMDLTASQVLGPTNGFWNEIQQIVILNDSFKPVAFGTQSQYVLS